MPTFTINITDVELKALESNIADVQEWLENAISNKTRKVVDRIVEIYTDKQPSKLSWEEKLTTVSGLDLPRAAYVE